MNIVEIIAKKRDGFALTAGEIDFFVKGVNDGSIPDYQTSALLMAIYLNGMNDEETYLLTDAMAKSGDTMDLSFINGIKVDKHSSGGVGDKVTLVVAPMVAACGLPVAKMSGRGLGFSGGTIDKLESVSGFRTALSKEEFTQFVWRDGISIMGQTQNVAPADKKLYALRDVTGTVASLPLIAASIMSKKLACNSDAIVLDVKWGTGAFMKTAEDAVRLAEKMVAIGLHHGKKMVAAVTSMNQPLGFTVGNALEVKEAVEALKGGDPADLTELCLTVGGFMLVLGEKAQNLAEAKKMLTETIVNGSAFAKFKQFIGNQGGNVSQIENTSLLPQAKYILPVAAPQNGTICAIAGEKIGNACIEIGAGRVEKSDAIDHAAGVVICKKIGDKVKAGDVLAYVHANNEAKGQKAVETVISAYGFGTAEKQKMIFAYIDKDGVHYE